MLRGADELFRDLDLNVVRTLSVSFLDVFDDTNDLVDRRGAA